MADGETKATEAAESGYLAELLRQWRALAAITLALAAGFPFSPYIASIMGPHLIRDLGWTRAEFASIGGLLMIGLICFPVAGRVSDFLGVKRTALIGAVALPLTYVALSTLSGDIRRYALIWVIQISVGATVGAMVYSQAIVHFVKRARGRSTSTRESMAASSG
jgi:Na+/melibiose symporter-like transporter